MSRQPKDENAAVCHAVSSPAQALLWTTLAFFGGFAGVSAFGPIVSRIKTDMGIDPLLTGILAASPALTGSLLRVPFGAMVDRFGGKKPILVLLGMATAGVAGITALFAGGAPPTADQYPLFLLWGVLCGSGIAVFSVGIPSVSYWYPQRRQGTALALYAGLGNLAPGMFAVLLPLLVDRFGFSTSYTLWTGLLALLFLLIAVFLRDAPYFQYQKMGIEIDPDALLHACGEELLPSGRAFDSIRNAAADWRTWILTFFYFVTFGGFIALTVWLPTYWAELFGFSMVRAGLLTSGYSLGASLLRVAGGFAADRFGGERVALLSFAVVALGAAAMSATTDLFPLALAGQCALALGMGFANAAVFKLVPTYAPKSVGGAAGIVGGLGAFGGFAIPPIMGLFVEWRGEAGYARGFLVFLGLAVISLALFPLLRRSRGAV
jgi:NNP family nitrate/nitrite transporter-like MFS transporter